MLNKCFRLVLPGALVLCQLYFAVWSYAQEHVNFPALAGYQAWDTQNNYDAADFLIAKSKYQTVEGYKTICLYNLADEKKLLTEDAILNHFDQQVKRLGGKLLHKTSSANASRSVLRYNRQGRLTWVEVYVTKGGREYQLTIVEDGEVNRGR